LRDGNGCVGLNSIGDAVIATDAQGLVVLMNPVAEELTGGPPPRRRPTSSRGLPLLTTPDSPSKTRAAKFSRWGASSDSNHSLNSRGGSERSTIAAALIKDEVGEILGVVLVFRDATEIRRAGKR
jgi:PAS domain-containing protein